MTTHVVSSIGSIGMQPIPLLSPSAFAADPLLRIVLGNDLRSLQSTWCDPPVDLPNRSSPFHRHATDPIGALLGTAAAVVLGAAASPDNFY